jgi:phenylpropionate dioxygenase-like ring-hydroxylating dioxygenase large terminal subunit
MNSRGIEQLVNRQQPGWTLEQPFYTDPQIFEHEWKNIWSKYWLFAGTTAEIPKAGDFFTYQAYRDSIIIIRGDKGEIFAHYNTCRHRGSLVCLKERGNSPKLMCPYHQWVYNKDGSLFKARLMPEDFDKSGHGLHPVRVEVVSGLIFISLSADAPDFSRVIRDFKPFLDPYKVDKAKVAYRKTYELRTNWKLVAENFRECYHCGIAHPEYCSVVVGANLTESADAVNEERRLAWKAKGLPIDTIDFENDSFHFAIRYPLRPGFESYSLDGKPAAKPMGDHKDFDAGVLGMVLLPGFWMDAVSDYMWFMRVTALSPSQTVIDLTWLVDGSAVPGVDYSVERLTEFWKITGEQDWKLCENNYKGVESSRYEPGPYAPVEAEVAKFISWYLERLQTNVGEEV